MAAKGVYLATCPHGSHLMVDATGEDINEVKRISKLGRGWYRGKSLEAQDEPQHEAAEPRVPEDPEPVEPIADDPPAAPAEPAELAIVERTPKRKGLFW